MNYDEYSYLWPTRPESAVPSGMLGFYEKRGWWAQVKKNGTCTMIFTNGRQVIFKTRHGAEAEHRAWVPKPEHVKFFQGNTYKWNVYVAELLHSKTPLIKDTLYIHDKLVDEGTHLVGISFEERQMILQSEWDGDQEPHFRRVNKEIVVAANFTGDFTKVYDDIVKLDDNPQDEGLVLKNPKAPLKACLRQNANNGWMVKVRRPHKNYGF